MYDLKILFVPNVEVNLGTTKNVVPNTKSLQVRFVQNAELGMENIKNHSLNIKTEANVRNADILCSLTGMRKLVLKTNLQKNAPNVEVEQANISNHVRITKSQRNAQNVEQFMDIIKHAHKYKNARNAEGLEVGIKVLAPYINLEKM